MRRFIQVNPLPEKLACAATAHPSDDIAAHAFDQFVGSWDMTCVFTSADGDQTTFAGEWHFGWILGGRMVQDVLHFYPPGEKPQDAAELKGGTTVRLFDPKAGVWLVTWFAAMRGEVIHLRGGLESDRIVLQGMDVDGSALRWSFNDIEETSFRWLGEISVDGGKQWRTEQEMTLRRVDLADA